MLKPFGLVVVAAALFAPLIWLPGIAQGRDVIAMFSQYIGMTALIAMAISQLIATRWLGVEALFGPLDKSYRLHKWLGIWALVASFLHDTIDADMQGVRPGPLEEVAETAGEISLYGLLILLIITVATFIPYHLWKWTHRFIGVFFVLSAFHYLFIAKPFSNGDPLGLYMGIVCLIGLVAYVYTSMPRAFRSKRGYRVADILPEGDALAVTLQPEARPLKHHAGQFAFLSFPDIGMTEPHPFTLSAPPSEDGSLRFSIAPLGDYTIRLRGRLKAGAKARVEGPFGDFRAARGDQVWIAAGIGITPFVAMAGALEAGDTREITLVYCVRDRSKAAHLAELEAAAAASGNLKLVLWESAQKGRLDSDAVVEVVGDLTGKHVLYCGPAGLRNALGQGLRKHGLSPRRFHYELFEIRTGIGLKWLYEKLTARGTIT